MGEKVLVRNLARAAHNSGQLIEHMIHMGDCVGPAAGLPQLFQKHGDVVAGATVGQAIAVGIENLAAYARQFHAPDRLAGEVIAIALTMGDLRVPHRAKQEHEGEQHQRPDNLHADGVAAGCIPPHPHAACPIDDPTR